MSSVERNASWEKASQRNHSRGSWTTGLSQEQPRTGLYINHSAAVQAAPHAPCGGHTALRTPRIALLCAPPPHTARRERNAHAAPQRIALGTLHTGRSWHRPRCTARARGPRQQHSASCSMWALRGSRTLCTLQIALFKAPSQTLCPRHIAQCTLRTVVPDACAITRGCRHITATLVWRLQSCVAVKGIREGHTRHRNGHLRPWGTQCLVPWSSAPVTVASASTKQPQAAA